MRNERASSLAPRWALAAATLAVSTALAGQALAQTPELNQLRQQVWDCTPGTAECEQLRDQLMIRLGERLELCTADCQPLSERLQDQLRLRECDFVTGDCLLLHEQLRERDRLRDGSGGGQGPGNGLGGGQGGGGQGGGGQGPGGGGGGNR